MLTVASVRLFFGGRTNVLLAVELRLSPTPGAPLSPLAAPFVSALPRSLAAFEPSSAEALPEPDLVFFSSVDFFGHLGRLHFDGHLVCARVNAIERVTEMHKHKHRRTTQPQPRRQSQNHHHHNHHHHHNNNHHNHMVPQPPVTTTTKTTTTTPTTTTR